MSRVKMFFSDFNLLFRKNLVFIIIFVVFASFSNSFVMTFLSKYKDEVTFMKELENLKEAYNIAFLKSDIETNNFGVEYINLIFNQNGIPKVIDMTLISEDEVSYYVRCKFVRALDKDCIAKIESLVKFNVMPLYDSAIKNQIIEYRIVVSIILAMLLLVAFNILNLNRYLIKKNRYRFTIYKICGGSNRFVFFLIYCTPLLITAISFGFGVLMYRYFVYGLFRKLDKSLYLLNWDIVFISFFASLAYCFVLLVPSVLAILKRGVNL